MADSKAAVRVVAQDRNLRSPGASVADPETTPGMSIVTAVADAHVHIHACYAPDELLDNAYANLSQSGAGEHAAANQALFLLMTETPVRLMTAIPQQVKSLILPSTSMTITVVQMMFAIHQQV